MDGWSEEGREGRIVGWSEEEREEMMVGGREGWKDGRKKESLPFLRPSFLPSGGSSDRRVVTGRGGMIVGVREGRMAQAREELKDGRSNGGME